MCRSRRSIWLTGARDLVLQFAPLILTVSAPHFVASRRPDRFTHAADEAGSRGMPLCDRAESLAPVAAACSGCTRFSDRPSRCRLSIGPVLWELPRAAFACGGASPRHLLTGGGAARLYSASGGAQRPRKPERALFPPLSHLLLLLLDTVSTLTGTHTPWASSARTSGRCRTSSCASAARPAGTEVSAGHRGCLWSLATRVFFRIRPHGRIFACGDCVRSLAALRRPRPSQAHVSGLQRWAGRASAGHGLPPKCLTVVSTKNDPGMDVSVYSYGFLWSAVGPHVSHCVS